MNDYKAIPLQQKEWLNSLPQQNCGDLYAIIKWPYLPIYTKHKVPVIGQVCDGQDHRRSVHLMLYNDFYNRGKGFTYVSWEAYPYNPELNNYSRSGKVKDPKPYCGVAYK